MASNFPIIEAETDGRSLIIWVGGEGVRIQYPSEQAADTAMEFVLRISGQFYAARELGYETVQVYGTELSQQEFIDKLGSYIIKAGYPFRTNIRRDPETYDYTPEAIIELY